MNDIDMNDVASLEFVNETNGLRFRFVLKRDAMYEMEDRMRSRECEPILVVDRSDANVWWTDDYLFLVDCLGLSDDMDAMIWAQLVTESNVWWIYEDGVVYRADDGTTIRAKVSTVPCDEEHGTCTNGCKPIEL